MTKKRAHLKAGRKRKPPPITLPGQSGQVELRAAQVDDPYQKGASIHVMRNILATPLAAIHARGRLQGPRDRQEDAEARRLAGERLRALHEKAELPGARGVDYNRVRVDVSHQDWGVTESVAEAMHELTRLAKRLGRHHAILHALIREESPFMRYVEQTHGRAASSAERLKVYQEFREALDALIEAFGVGRGR